MSKIRFATVPMPSSPNPPAGKFFLAFDSNNSDHLTIQDSTGALFDIQSAGTYTDEDAQDAVGAALSNTATVAFTYNDLLNTISADVIPGAIDHDSLLNYGGNEHVDHSAVVLSAGHGLTGGGDITANRSFAVNEAAVDHDALQNFVANKHIDHSAVSITAGTGLTGGGDITASRTLSVNPAAVDHNALQNFDANKHIDHTAVSIATASDSGLTGGGTIAATRNLSLEVTGMITRNFPGANFLVPGYSPTLAGHRKVTRAMLMASDTDNAFSLQSDFIESATGGLTSTVLGTGASTQAGTYGLSTAEQCRGVSQSDTGTTATGRVALNTAATNSMFFHTTDTYRLAFRMAPEALSSPTETFTLWMGFSNGHQASGTGSHFIGFRYTDAVNGGKWQTVCRLNSIDQDVSDSGVLVGIDYQVLEIRTNGVTSVEFYIDGTLVKTFNWTVSPTSADLMGWGMKMEKSVGLTQRNVSVDWYSFDYIRSAAR